MCPHHPFPKSHGHPKSMNKLTLNKPAIKQDVYCLGVNQLFFTVGIQSCSKVIFSQASGSHSFHRGMSCRHPSWAGTPQADTPRQTPPWADTPPGRQTPGHTPLGRPPFPWRPLQRTVCILLECFLVINLCGRRCQINRS